MDTEKIKTALKYAINELEHSFPTFDPNEEEPDLFEALGVARVRVAGGISLIRGALTELEKNECNHEYEHISTTAFIGYICKKCGHKI